MAKPVPKAPLASGQLALQKSLVTQSQQQQEAIRAKAAYSAHKNLNAQLIASSNTAGFVPMKTLSGRSLGSLGKYSMDWNNADICEASSVAPIPDYPLSQLVSGKPLDLASPITVGHRMYAAKAAVLELDRAIEVRLPSSHIPSPRDSGGVTCHSA